MKKHKVFSVFLAASVLVSSMWLGLPSRADTVGSPITNLSDLQTALNNAVTNGSTVTMTQNLTGSSGDTNIRLDVPSGKTVIFDGNGKTLTAANSTHGDSIALTVSGGGHAGAEKYHSGGW